MIGGVAAVIVVYLLVNVRAVVRPADRGLARSTLPAADAAQILLGGRGRVISDPSIVSLRDAQRHPDDRDADSVRDGRDGPCGAGRLGDRAWNAAAAMLGPRWWRLRSSPPARFSGSCRVAFFLAANYVGCCSRSSRCAGGRGPRATVPRVGLPVVRRSGFVGVPRPRRTRGRHDQRAGCDGASRGWDSWSAAP